MSNKNAIFTTLGASNHVKEEREKNDFYATDPIAAEYLCDLIDINNNILEPCCGKGHLSKVFIRRGFNVTQSDLIDRMGNDTEDFLKRSKPFNGDIITNPPYKYAKEFVEHALKLIPEGNKVCMFLKLTFLESKKRRELFEISPCKTIYVSSSRIKCAKNGDFSSVKSSAACYAWFIWEKGYKGEMTIKLFN